MSKTLTLMLSSSPFNESTYFGLKLALTAARKGWQVNLYLYGESVQIANNELDFSTFACRSSISPKDILNTVIENGVSVEADNVYLKALSINKLLSWVKESNLNRLLQLSRKSGLFISITG